MSEPVHNPADDEAPRKKLSEEDMARVAEYLNLPQHRRERQPFRPMALLMVLVVIVVGMSLVSLWYAKAHGVLL
ncbi:MAG TPA: DUF3094 family protein [Pseudomonadales bacterium]|jgi:hypothetical protein|nr:DUF3094 family protein [Pseudomonadales bacterium]HRG50856.1 DUF3094 family protein [Pseudomonadales bacterium]